MEKLTDSFNTRIEAIREFSVQQLHCGWTFLQSGSISNIQTGLSKTSKRRIRHIKRVYKSTMTLRIHTLLVLLFCLFFCACQSINTAKLPKPVPAQEGYALVLQEFKTVMETFIDEYYRRPSAEEIHYRLRKTLEKHLDSLSVKKEQKADIRTSFQQAESTEELLSSYMLALDAYTRFPEGQTYDTYAEGLISPFLARFDSYSRYYDRTSAEQAESIRTGNFGGVGMTLGMQEGQLSIIKPFQDTPAFRAGLQPNDRIMRIDGILTRDMGIQQAVKRIRGEPGTTVTLTIRRGKEKPFPADLVREMISIPSVEHQRIGNTLYIQVKSFTGHTVESLDSLLEMSSEWRESIILDLRGNPGGLAIQAIHTVNLFTNHYRGYLVETQNSTHAYGYEVEYHQATTDPLVVLIDKRSASASEIVSGALKIHTDATLIGMTTFGKGTTQGIFELGEESAMKITVAKNLLSDYTPIDSHGIDPHYFAESIDHNDSAPGTDQDFVLNLAKHYLNGERWLFQTLLKSEQNRLRHARQSGPGDDTPPKIELFTPYTDEGVIELTAPNTKEIHVSGRVTDNIAVSRVEVNGQPVTIGKSGFFKTKWRRSDEDTLLEVMAWDPAGNRAYKPVLMP